MVLAFENHFDRHYEGGARWLHDVLTALGTLADPPMCYVVGVSSTSLPVDLRTAGHVTALPWKRTPEFAMMDSEVDDLLDGTGAQLWIGRHLLPILASGIPRLMLA
jgi:hypothetical protein